MADTNKYAHTRAFISHLAREYPGEGSYDPNDTGNDGEGGGNPKANAALVKKVVRLLEEEDEDGLKLLIKQTFSIDESVSRICWVCGLFLLHRC
jgi:hypothetical protein